MRVLWFTNTPVNYNTGNHKYNGGGWMSALEAYIKEKENVQLAISFKTSTETDGNRLINGVEYYPLYCKPESGIKKLLHSFNMPLHFNIEQCKGFIDKQLRIIESFKPDIIQVFGSEEEFGLISMYTNIPVVLHLQGLLNPYYEVLLPPGFSWFDYICSGSLIDCIKNYRHKCIWELGKNREKVILKETKYFIGRTEWDRRISRLFSPDSHYFYGGEILRSVFYQSHIRQIPSKLNIVTTISQPLYKGFDLVLRTAKILKEQLDFEWDIYGNINPDLSERKTNICHKNVNVHLKGVASPETLNESILNSTVYVHPSYIDNSPNSICEAQILGCTVIASNVGGVSSLIQDGVNGYLVPANDPYQLAYLILYIYSNPEINRQIGIRSKEDAIIRHDGETISDQLVTTYNEIIKLNER